MLFISVNCNKRLGVENPLSFGHKYLKARCLSLSIVYVGGGGRNRMLISKEAKNFLKNAAFNYFLFSVDFINFFDSTLY